MRGKNDFKPGELVQHTIYGRVGLVLQDVTSSVMADYIDYLTHQCPPTKEFQAWRQPQRETDPSTHRYYKVLFNGRVDIYSPYYLELLKKGKNNEQ